MLTFVSYFLLCALANSTTSMFQDLSVVFILGDFAGSVSPLVVNIQHLFLFVAHSWIARPNVPFAS